MSNQAKLHICLVASAGGHLTELLRLSEVWMCHDVFVITTAEEVRSKMQPYGRVYVTKECNRFQFWRLLEVLVGSIRLIFLEKPDIILSTGAAPGCITCFVGKLMGAKVIWLDSITNVERISLSGWLVRFIADLFLVQWFALAEKYPKAEYLGMVI